MWALAVMEISSLKLRMGFRLGIYTIDKVVEWVTSEIGKADEPSNELLDLSLATTKGVHDTYSALYKLNNSPENDIVLIEILSEIRISDLNNIKFCRDLAQKLYTYYVDQNYEVNSQLSEIGFFDDGYDLAMQGIAETVEEWHESFKEFIKNC